MRSDVAYGAQDDNRGSNEMVNAAVTNARSAERALAIGYAPVSRRAGLAALFALDARLGDVLRTTREPLVGQMRLAWWRDGLAALDGRGPPAEPILAALALHVLPLGVSGGELAAICAGWERLLADPLDAAVLGDVGAGRGGVLFALAARLLAADRAGLDRIGEGWALADLAGHLGDPALAGEAKGLARSRLDGIAAAHWPRALRPLGALALLARSDLADGVPGSPGRIARIAFHRLTGR